MKLITSTSELRSTFLKLLNHHREFHGATAWASVAHEPFVTLRAKTAKISRLVVGLHFYQTHPDFIRTFLRHKDVRFVKQTQGVFHPKLFLFYSSIDDWDLLVGSTNFTAAAFTVNTEATGHVSAQDAGAAEALKNARSLIETSWKQATAFTQTELDAYETVWINQKSKLGSLSGQYQQKQITPPKPMHQVPVTSMTWAQFMSKVRHDQYKSLDSRLEVLGRIKEWFSLRPHFSNMTADERKFVAGLPNPLNKNRAPGDWFGSMKGSGVFASAIADNDKNVSRALDEIPLSGEITKAHFDSFLKHYRLTFDGSFIATATRLLAMKRPDTFVCLDSKNRRALCLDFAVPQSSIDYEQYWNAIVLRIRDCEFWLNPKPQSQTEHLVSEARAAFLDSVYYDHPELKG